MLGVFHSFVVFFLPVSIFQHNSILLESGQNIDLWSVSITSFTCLYSAVTTKIILWTRWWTWVSFVFYSWLAIFVYIAYVWFSEIWSESRVQWSVTVTHGSALFYLSVLLCGGVIFLIDLALLTFQFEYRKDASDFVRQLLESKKGYNDLSEGMMITARDITRLD